MPTPKTRGQGAIMQPSADSGWDIGYLKWDWGEEDDGINTVLTNNDRRPQHMERHNSACLIMGEI